SASTSGRSNDLLRFRRSTPATGVGMDSSSGAAASGKIKPIPCGEMNRDARSLRAGYRAEAAAIDRANPFKGTASFPPSPQLTHGGRDEGIAEVPGKVRPPQ